MRRRNFLFTAGVSLATAPAASVLRTPTEVEAAAKQARSGDILVLGDGEWTDADLVFEAHGAEGRPVVVRAQTPGKVILTGNSRLRFGGEWISVEGITLRGCRYSRDVLEFRTAPGKFASHSRMADCAVVDCSPADKETVTRFVSLYGEDNEVSRCYFAGKTNAGPTMVVWLGGKPNRHRIAANWFGPRVPLGHNGGESLRVGDSTTSMRDSLTAVERNLFDRCDGELEIISNKSCGNLYRGNLFDSCVGTLTLRHGNRCRVEKNLFLGHGLKDTGGVRVIGEDHVVAGNYFEGLRGKAFRAALSVANGLPDSPLNGYFQVKRATLRDNVIVDCTEGVAIGVNGGNVKLTLPPEDVRAENNVVRERGEEAPAFDRSGAGPGWWPKGAFSG